MPVEADAVYYAPKDYASIPRRIASFLLDILVVVFLIAVVSSAVQVSLVPMDVNAMPRSPEKQKLIKQYLKPARVPMVLGWFVLVVAYHVVLRTTRGGTLGYRLTRIRLVDMTGRVPALKALLRRFLLAVPGCLLFGATYLNCLRNPTRRAGHDQWSGTWLVRTRAEPAGPARPVYQTRLFGTFLLTFVDVEPATEEGETSEPEKDGGI
ncbi:MAG: RDD family protein [Phycisphaerae bacterium]